MLPGWLAVLAVLAGGLAGCVRSVSSNVSFMEDTQRSNSFASLPLTGQERKKREREKEREREREREKVDPSRAAELEQMLPGGQNESEEARFLSFELVPVSLITPRSLGSLPEVSK